MYCLTAHVFIMYWYCAVISKCTVYVSNMYWGTVVGGRGGGGGVGRAGREEGSVQGRIIIRIQSFYS